MSCYLSMNFYLKDETCFEIPLVHLLSYINSTVYYYFNFRCQIPGLNNDTYNVQNNQHASKINKTIPPSHDEIHKYDRCHYYQYRNNTRDTVKCSKWVYDTNTFHETFASKVCVIVSTILKTIWNRFRGFGGETSRHVSRQIKKPG